MPNTLASSSFTFYDCKNIEQMFDKVNSLICKFDNDDDKYKNYTKIMNDLVVLHRNQKNIFYGYFLLKLAEVFSLCLRKNKDNIKIKIEISNKILNHEILIVKDIDLINKIKDYRRIKCLYEEIKKNTISYYFHHLLYNAALSEDSHVIDDIASISLLLLKHINYSDIFNQENHLFNRIQNYLFSDNKYADRLIAKETMAINLYHFFSVLVANGITHGLAGVPSAMDPRTLMCRYFGLRDAGSAEALLQSLYPEAPARLDKAEALSVLPDESVDKHVNRVFNAIVSTIQKASHLIKIGILLGTDAATAAAIETGWQNHTIPVIPGRSRQAQFFTKLAAKVNKADKALRHAIRFFPIATCTSHDTDSMVSKETLSKYLSFIENAMTHWTIWRIIADPKYRESSDWILPDTHTSHSEWFTWHQIPGSYYLPGTLVEHEEVSVAELNEAQRELMAQRQATIDEYAREGLLVKETSAQAADVSADAGDKKDVDTSLPILGFYKPTPGKQTQGAYVESRLTALAQPAFIVNAPTTSSMTVSMSASSSTSSSVGMYVDSSELLNASTEIDMVSSPSSSASQDVSTHSALSPYVPSWHMPALTLTDRAQIMAQLETAPLEFRLGIIVQYAHILHRSTPTFSVVTFFSGLFSTSDSWPSSIQTTVESLEQRLRPALPNGHLGSRR